MKHIALIALVCIAFATQVQAQDHANTISEAENLAREVANSDLMQSEKNIFFILIMVAIIGAIIAGASGGYSLPDLVQEASLSDLVQDYSPATFLDDIPSIAYPVLENLEWVQLL